MNAFKQVEVSFDNIFHMFLLLRILDKFMHLPESKVVLKTPLELFVIVDLPVFEHTVVLFERAHSLVRLTLLNEAWDVFGPYDSLRRMNEVLGLKSKI